MNVLQLKIFLILEGASHAPKALQIYGPLFHRWLPEGEKDAISLDTEDPNAKLKIWFERIGFVDGGFIKFDYERRAIDLEVMSRQAILQGGPLWGLLKIDGLSYEEMSAIRDNKTGDEAYVNLGGRVAKKLLHPPISKFLQLLKTNYGQYWIPDLKPWDSRTESLGGYFAGGSAGLFVKWSIDGVNWENFRPDRPSHTTMGSLGRDFSDYPTREDWLELKEAAESNYEPTLAALALARAHRLKDQGNIRHAIVEGVTALEIALSDFLRATLEQESDLIGHVQAFYNLPLKTQLLTLVVNNSKVSMADVKETTKLIEVRNDIVHEAKSPSTNDEARIPALFRTVAAFISGPRFRFPRLITSENMLFGANNQAS